MRTFKNILKEEASYSDADVNDFAKDIIDTIHDYVNDNLMHGNFLSPSDDDEVIDEFLMKVYTVVKKNL